MAHNYISASERERLDQVKKSKEALDAAIAKQNTSFVGEPKEYKGIKYQMKQNGTYECLNASHDGPFAGAFTSPQAIRKLANDLEKMGQFRI
jgi:hypothetical protein